MAKNTNRQRTRAQREAQRAAAEKARAEQAAKERRQQTILGATVVAVIVVIIAVVAGVIWWKNRPVDTTALKSEVDKVAVKPASATDDYGFLISKDGINKPVEGVPTVEFYMDFICPGCGNMERSTGETNIKMVEAGQINLEVHPLSFMDSYSTDNYSTRAANAVINVAEQDPTHLLAFIQALYSQDFQPQEGSNYVATSDAQIQQQAVKAGVSEDLAKTISDGKYNDWIAAETQVTINRKELANVSGRYKGQVSTPIVTINGTYWDWNSIDTGTTLAQGLLKAIGLDEAQVGTSTLPSIGADGKPLYPAS
ncbi:DsbA family protein [Bifidobacterium avesanii]|uniref:Thioredoxin domain-containing protein n=1 Tax=Bifidobacterium avesanii TaxID=1798157 RepID=A0A7K3TIC9_9BIFI|nr:thioredoxin domain-containing protein [Bifidobacterium avesanii]KAB8291981.1 DSBA oxidoreductase [Bifidobacterium avesanii]NEG78656.1 thioredoxin domain-containing protein [Bifidobacterium avesanii]